jgi:fermentation-respiration switch protein FrsA (DUF1100 family)
LLIALADWLLLAFPILAADGPAAQIDGSWQGSLKAGAFELRVVFHIDKDEKGQLKATLDSPDQGAKGIPVDAVSLSGDDVKIEIKRIGGSFEGKLAEGGGAISGQWKQLGKTAPLDLKRLEKKPEDGRPQDPKKPYPYAEEEVAYENAAAKIKLAGTLTLPKADKSVPAVLLITGSGPQDRNETVMGHRPFLVLADYLTRHGIAVLRVDDRGVGGSTGDTSTSTTDDLAGDVQAGVEFLKARKEVDPRRIGLIGHSEGGIIAPLVASRSGDVAFIVLLAGTGVTGDEIINRQGELIAAAMYQGEELAKVKAGQVVNRQISKILKEETDPAKAEAQIRELLAKTGELADGLQGETLEAVVDAQLKQILSPWFRYFLSHDPTHALRKVRCPVLAINGEKDLQVDPKQNLAPIEAALKAGGNTDYTTKEMPGLNHLFQHCETGAPSEYSKIEETMSPEVLELIAGWICERAK